MTVPLEDRLPTFAEVEGFDAGAAWDRLTPEQQRDVGMRAVSFGTIGQCINYVYSSTDAPASWSPAQIAQATWSRDQLRQIERREDEVTSAHLDHLESLWPQLFGWTSTPITTGELQR